MIKPGILIAALTLFIFMGDEIQAQDWANLDRFREENAELGPPAPGEKRVVFMGNSITEEWSRHSPGFFERKTYINRGISGQATPQMLVRFRADVINLKPEVVVILAGTNDIAGNTGPSSLEMIMNNLKSMAELAKANDIKVILCSVLPAYDYPWNPGLNPDKKIPALNEMIKVYARKNDFIYLDYFSSMVDEGNALKDAYTYDCVHPNEAGYKVMEPLLEKTIAKALRKSTIQY
ncbi:MAG: SGNH/GDSL hydrolase family protein [Bacteroidota bacterium]|nr:SGNH/GDSL hydrolase family protein [Bacteroidota bacterium]